MNQVIKFLKLWIPALLWAGIIFYFSSKPRLDSGLEDIESGLLDFVLRKCVHMFEYFVLTGLLCRAIKGSFVLEQNRLLFYSSVVAVSYALMDEYHQTFVPTRMGSIFDVMVDTIGVLVAYVVLRCQIARAKMPSKG